MRWTLYAPRARLTLHAQTDATTTGRKPKVLHREVTRVISPGTFIDERFLDPREASYLLALVHSEAGDGTTGLVWLDLSTGQLRTLSCPTTAVSGELARLRPREVLVLNGNMANVRSSRVLAFFFSN